MSKNKPQPQKPARRPDVPRPTEVNPLPPQSDELRKGQSLLGSHVRASIGGHMLTIELTDYDVSNNTYFGLAVRCRSIDSSEQVPVFHAVKGLRPYPYDLSPKADFQFVLPGEDESVLINIAQANAVRS